MPPLRRARSTCSSASLIVPLSPSKQTVVEQRRMIDAVGIADQRVGEAGEIDEAMPIGIVARKARHFEAEHEPDVGERHLGGETRKAGSCNRAGAGKAEVLVDDENAIVGPAELARFAGKRILPLRRFAIVLDLARRSIGEDRRSPGARDALAVILARSFMACLLRRSVQPACGR